MSLKQQAEELYKTKYAGHGLAPKHVIALKEVITKALRKKEKPNAAAKAWLKEKGIVLDGVKEPTPAPTSSKKKAPAAEPAPKKKEPTPVVPTKSVEVNMMDRKDLKATIAQLKAAGVDIEYMKSDDDGTLKRKVNDAMASLASPDVLKVLETIDPARVVNTLGQKECLGLYIDLRAPGCVSCVDAVTCVKQYLVNLKGNFGAFKDAMTDIKTEEAAKALPEKEIEKVAKKTKAEKKAETPTVKPITYEPKRKIFVMDVENPVADDADAHTTIQLVLDNVPATEKELRKLVEQEWDITDDDGFAHDWVTGLRHLNVIKFEEDLTAEEREALEAAGAL